MKQPTIGRTVHYILTEQDCNQINHGHDGTTHTPGQHVPMLVTRVTPDDTHGVNGQVFSDAACTLWRGSLKEDPAGTQPGTWHWPEGTRENTDSLALAERQAHKASPPEPTFTKGL